MFCTLYRIIHCTGGFSALSVLGPLDFLKHEIAELLSMNHHRAPRSDGWNIRGSIRPVKDAGIAQHFQPVI